MNYYEQFYDDLEFCDPEDDPYRYNDPHYHEDPGRYGDDRYYGERDHGYYPHSDREVPYSRGHLTEEGRVRDQGPSRGQGYTTRGRGGSDRGHVRQENMGNRGRGRGEGNSFQGPRGRGEGNSFQGPRGRGERNSTQGSRGRGEGDSSRGPRGNLPRGNIRGGIKIVNFVKAEADNTTSEQKTRQNEGESKGDSDQIRFDYTGYQNEPSQNEVEVKQAIQAACQMGFGYGYGPRSDLIEGDQLEWLISPEVEAQAEVSGPSPSLLVTQSQPAAEVKTEPNTVVKKAMVNPACNFVKAKSEFHSIAFHESQQAMELKPKPNSLSVNFGNKKVGLGFGVSKSSAPSVDISLKFHAGLKGGCNPQIDARFARLQEAVKARINPNKNAIEILHMAVDKVKMVINDEVHPGGRTSVGQPMFICRLEIDGVFVAQGQATAKKAAKHEAYQSSLTVFSNGGLTVQEISQGVFELRAVECKVPNTSGNSATMIPGQKPTYIPGVKSQTGTSLAATKSVTGTQSTTVNAITTSTISSNTSLANTTSYGKPKIVFHQPSHPLNNKPLQFQKAEAGMQQGGTQGMQEGGTQEMQQGGTQDMQPGTSSLRPEALAMKLLNFVKEGSGIQQEKINSDVNQSNAIPSSNYHGNQMESMNQSNRASQNVRKRPADRTQNFDTGRLKIQRKGGNVNHSIEDLSQFILIDSTPVDQSVNELSMLHNSANFNKVVLKVEYENDHNMVRCSLVISDIVVSISHGETKADARQHAVTDALNYLHECCYTIKIKQAVDTDASGLTKEQLLSDIQKAGGGGSEVIPDSNIGNMLLRKMGWVGGGCGKDGKGRAEPVTAERVVGREGLGLTAEKGIGKNFHQKVTKMLQDYIKSDEQKDLHFASDLQKEERAIIHTIGQKLGLKTHSKGKATNRYLIVSRKRSAQQLLEHVWESGGSTSKYELIPPGDSDLDMMRREDLTHGHCKQ